MTYGNVTISADYSDLDDLVQLLTRATERPHRERAVALVETAVKVENEARTNAQAFHIDSTGELAAAITRAGTPVFQRIFANVRHAAFLEYGSPTTGPPRPWLTGPARRGADDLFERISRTGDLW